MMFIQLHMNRHNYLPIPFKYEGILVLRTLYDTTVKIHAYVTPSIDHNILSTSNLRAQGLFMNERHHSLENADGQIAARFITRNDLSWLPVGHIVYPGNARLIVINAIKTKYPLSFIHRLFGHVNVQSIYQPIKNGTFRNINLDDIDWSNISKFQCIYCLQGKSRKQRHVVGSRLQYQTKFSPFKYIHSDLFGPVRVGGTKPEWFISFTDKCSKFRWVFLLKSKEDSTILHIIKSFVATLERQFHVKVLTFQFDRGTEYTNKAVRTYRQEQGILIIYTSVAGSQSHSIAERLNLTLLNDCRTLLKTTHLPNFITERNRGHVLTSSEE